MIGQRQTEPRGGYGPAEAAAYAREYGRSEVRVPRGARGSRRALRRLARQARAAWRAWRVAGRVA